MILRFCSTLAAIAVAGSGWAQPAAAKRDSIPDAGRLYRVPYRLTATKHIVVRARINGKGPYNFVLDTGAPDVFVAIERAREAGCRVGGNQSTVLRTLEIEGGPVLRRLNVRSQELFQLRSMNAMDAAGTRIDGVLGYTVIARFRVTIDLTRDRMDWTRLPYEPPGPPVIYELTRGKPLKAAGDARNMEQLARWASSLYQRKPSPPPVPRGFIGAELADTERGILLKATVPGSPANLAGLKQGDVIQAVRGPLQDESVEVRSVEDARRVLSDVLGGEQIRLRIVRGGRTLRVTVTTTKAGL